MSAPIFAFYGTLMSTSSAIRGQEMQRYGKVLGRFKTDGQMYSIAGAFPGVIPGEGTVYGELWQPHDWVDVDSVFDVLDTIEGADGTPFALYRREEREVEGPDGPVRAWIYIYNGVRQGHYERVESGDWNQWRAQELRF